MMVVEARQGLDAARDLTMLVEGSVDEILPVDATSATAAVEAWRRFGRARHPAGLNYRDCFAYGLARQRGVPLLYTGDDFTKTDLAQT